ncbi:MAG: N-6 DNA methylase [Candidatus Gastranaerophilales bacterium]|nr:N-6 DNA methylase [Candidatus Gastranaerophilales bacterium]
MEYITLKELCDEIEISSATAKNWIKLGKITPDYTNNSEHFFSKKHVKNLIKDIQSGEKTYLKSRRNKKFVSGSFLYKDYISTSSKNISTIETLLDYICSKEIKLKKSELQFIIADCAIQLLLQSKNLSKKVTKNCLIKFLNSEISIGIYDNLILDLIKDKQICLNFINKYPNLFSYEYIYEQGEDILGLLYISCSKINERKARGAYYTPTKIVKNLIKNLAQKNQISKKETITDPCCGTGNFLIQLPKNIELQQIFGNDIDETSIKITRINLALKFDIENINILYSNITQSDFLSKNYAKTFDYIIGNPPWGYGFSETTKQYLRQNFSSAIGKNIESYDVFIEKSLNCLKENGVLSFVLPEAILNVQTHKPIREIITKTCDIQYLEFLGNTFDKVQCPSVILQLKNTQKPICSINTKIKEIHRTYTIKKDRVINPHQFSFSCNDEEYSIIDKILNNNDNIYLKSNAEFALGIVTGNNKESISKTKTESNEIIFKGSDIYKYKIKNSENYIEFTPKNFQQVAPEKLYRAPEKLFYRFISNQLVFAYDNQKRLSLNSCNILIPKIKDYNIKYILAILNSRIGQFIFQKQFNSIKILRSHIEQIPIPKCSQNKQKSIIQIVDELLKENNTQKRLELYNKIDIEVSKLYKLKTSEYEIIKQSLENKNLFLD